MDLSIINPRSFGKEGTINEISSNSKVIKTKIEGKIMGSKSNNLVIVFLAKFLLFLKSSRLELLIYKARLAFTELR